MNKFLTLAAATLIVSGCAASGGSMADADADGAAAAIAAAEAANKTAIAAGAEWRDTGKMIKHAQEAAKKGEFAAAVKAAKKAQRQAENAVKQADGQKMAGPAS